jgi:hypothetical protein
MSTHGELAAYLALIFAGFLPSEVWRWLGVAFARGLDEDSEIVVWVRAVATAILAGVIAKLTIFAPGVLATVPTPVRLAAVAIGFLAFMLIRRSVFAGVLAGEGALIVGALLFGG